MSLTTRMIEDVLLALGKDLTELPSYSVATPRPVLRDLRREQGREDLTGERGSLVSGRRK